jgi:predicted dinucleotide-binding enzyme
MSITRIGVIGSGEVGETLANGLLQHGWEVMRGSRDPGKLAKWLAGAGAKARAGTFAEAAAFGELVVIAVKGTGAEAAVAQCGAALDGKVVIDTCNPIADRPPVDHVLEYFTGPNESLMERLQRQAPKARFVKAFSCVGNRLMVNPQLEARPSMFIAGDDGTAKAEVAGILDRFGWDIEDCGGAAGARAIEPLCILWCIPGFRDNDWAHAYRVLR